MRLSSPSLPVPTMKYVWLDCDPVSGSFTHLNPELSIQSTGRVTTTLLPSSWPCIVLILPCWVYRPYVREHPNRYHHRVKHSDLQVHGNASAENTNNNAARCLYAFAAKEHICVCPGAKKPLIRVERHDPEIHGIDGLGGVEGLSPATNPIVQARLVGDGTPVRALEGMAKAISTTWKNGEGSKVIIVSSGPMTNVALFVSVYPDLLGAVGEKLLAPASSTQSNSKMLVQKNSSLWAVG